MAGGAFNKPCSRTKKNVFSPWTTHASTPTPAAIKAPSAAWDVATSHLGCRHWGDAGIRAPHPRKIRPAQTRQASGPCGHVGFSLEIANPILLRRTKPTATERPTSKETRGIDTWPILSPGLESLGTNQISALQLQQRTNHPAWPILGPGLES